ncbi:MAG: serine/threonine-protein kinase [Planctomycetota bacterium]
MSDLDRERLRRLFDQALELPARAREAFLDSKCHGDGELKQRLHAMLAAADDQHVVPNSSDPQVPPPSPHTSAAAAEAALHEGPGAHIGPYKLLQQIGEGGFGTVFLAHQEQPVVRRVALKIIKLGMDTKQVVARFEQERQALALMDHPNIARVLDAGATTTGRPYFVMDLVKGDPIVEYCDEHKLTIDQRLELFEQVCHAVQHAHGKGIIHRDLKPSNVLVTTQDGTPHAKVIDFGIAKATFSRLTEKTLFTEHEQVIGTLQYMSPEQAEGSVDIDTRTDVYSLGVLLYELMTGSTPHEEKTVKAAMFGELRRIIREVDPPKPSTRLHDSSDRLASIAAHRSVEPRRLGMLLRGELDWIVMKALEKNRTRRYETANGLAADVRRYLAGEDVVAAPPSASYRLRKFMRRNKGAVGTALAVGIALLIGVIGFAWQAQLAGEQRDLALKAQLAEAEEHRRADTERDRAIAAENTTRQRADELGRVAEFQASMLSQIDTDAAGTKLFAGLRAKFAASIERQQDLSASERDARSANFERDLATVNATDAAARLIDDTILKPAIAAIDTQFTEQPTVRARLRRSLAQLLLGLGFYDEALAQQRLVLATRRSVLGEDHPDTLSAMQDLGGVFDAKDALADAEQCYRDVLVKRRALLGDDHPDTIRSTMGLGNVLRARGAYAEAEPLLRDAVAKSRTVLGDEHRETLVALNCLGQLFAAQGKFAETEPLWREAYETGVRVFGAEDPDVLVWLYNLANLLSSEGKLDEAQGHFEKALAGYRRIKGDQHPSTLTVLGGTAAFLARRGQFATAESMYRETLASSRTVLGPSHASTLRLMSDLGNLLARQGKVEEAERLFRESVAGCQNTLGDEDPDTLLRMADLTNLLRQVNRPDEAEPLARRILAGWTHARGPDDPETLVALSSLGMVLEQQGKLADAEPVDRQAMVKLRAARGDDHPTTINSIVALANVLRKLGRNTDAEPLYREALMRCARSYPKGHPTIAHAHLGLGRTLSDLRRFTDAEPELLAAEQLFAAAGGGSARMHAAAVESLASLYAAWHAAEPGEGHEQKAAEWRAKQAAGLAPSTRGIDGGK